MIALGQNYDIFVLTWLYAGASIIAFGLGYRMAACCMAQVLLPLEFVITSLSPYGYAPYCANIIAFGQDGSSMLSHGCMLYGASIIALGLGYLIFVIVWLCAVWHEYYCI